MVSRGYATKEEPVSCGPSGARQNRICESVLKSIGYPAHKSTLRLWVPKRKRTIEYFWNACKEAKLPLKWEKRQIVETLILLDKLHFTASTLKDHWWQIRQVSSKVDHQLSDVERNLYDIIIAHCKPVQDNKLPVSRELLNELCRVAPLVLQSYNAKLARATFLCAFAGFMQCCEYTIPQKGRKNHNVVGPAVTCTEQKLGISFWSDKVSYNDPMVKHCMIDWDFLLLQAKIMVAQYMDARPKNAQYFFVKEDGQPMTRGFFCKLLDVCILHMPWRFLNCTPHVFRAGGASSARLDGESIVDIEFYGRWGPKSCAIDHYTKPMLVHMKPDEIYKTQIRYRRKWTNAKLSYLSRNVVETRSFPNRKHPHEVMLKKFFADFFTRNMHKLPAKYPSLQVAYCITRSKRDRALGTFTKKFKFDQDQLKKFDVVRAKISALAQRTITLRGKGVEPPMDVHDLPSMFMQDVDERVSTEVQTPSTGIDRHEKACQFPEQETASSSTPTKKPKAEPSRTPALPPEGLPPTEDHEDIPPVPVISVEEVASQLAAENIDQNKQEFQPYIAEKMPPATKKRKRAHSTPATQPLTPEECEVWYGFCAGMVKNFGEQSKKSREHSADGVQGSLLRYKKSKEPVFAFYLTGDGQKILVSKDKLRTMKPGGATLPLTAVAAENKNLASKICWRISARYREHWTNTIIRSRKKAEGKAYPPQEELRRTNTIASLINHFFDEAVLKGVNVVPYIDEKDPVESSDEFKEKVLWKAEKIQKALPLSNRTNNGQETNQPPNGESPPVVVGKISPVQGNKVRKCLSVEPAGTQGSSSKTQRQSDVSDGSVENSADSSPLCDSEVTPSSEGDTLDSDDRWTPSREWRTR